MLPDRKLCLGRRSRRYACIIYNTLDIKCSQARVNNSSIKNDLGFFNWILSENTNQGPL